MLDNKIYVDRDFIRIDKNNRHLQLLYYASLFRSFPNVAYVLNRFAFGDKHPFPAEAPHVHEEAPCYTFRSPTDNRSGVPQDMELVIAKFHGYRQCGVLIPNMYFFNELGKWNATSRKISERASRMPWSERQGRAFWRGQILAQSKCHRDFGNYARWQALSLARRYPTEFAIYCLDDKPCDFRNDTSLPCPALPYDDTQRELHLEPRRLHSLPALPLGAFLQYKFLLNIPGTISGSYSRHLNLLWMFRSVVLLWDSPHVEYVLFYFFL